ncbi:AcrR family transcriptional regulator [Pseudomonas sp. TE3786]
MAYRHSAARIDRDQEQRERILDCALLLVVEGGFAALTMHGLAERVGIATGSLYRHFRGKGELAAEVFTRASQREVDALAASLALPGSEPQRLAAALHQFADRAWQSRRLAFALIAEPVDPEVDESRLVYREAYADLLGTLIAEGVQSGAFRTSSIAISAACLVGAISEALVGPLSPQARAAREAGEPTQQLADVSAALVSFCLRALASREACAEELLP